VFTVRRYNLIGRLSAERERERERTAPCGRITKIIPNIHSIFSLLYKYKPNLSNLSVTEVDLEAIRAKLS